MSWADAMTVTILSTAGDEIPGVPAEGLEGAGGAAHLPGWVGGIVRVGVARGDVR